MDHASPTRMELMLDQPLRHVLRLMQERSLNATTYFGIPTQKCPLDFWIYQEILHRVRPDVIIEIGNLYGGSTLALAHLCDLLGKGRILAIDIDHSHVRPEARHARITWLTGDACAMFGEVQARIAPGDVVLLIEDSSHTYENTLNILNTYSALITPGSYLIVEDGICHHGLEVGPNPGPYEAIETFIASGAPFVIDSAQEGFVITWNPKGYLRRLAPTEQVEQQPS